MVRYIFLNTMESWVVFLINVHAILLNWMEKLGRAVSGSFSHILIFKVEHYFQAMKFDNEDHQEEIRKASNALKAIQLGKYV